MQYFILILAGLAGGALGGMGMGGGTLLIPILTIFLKIPQNIAQWINLLTFIPMATIAVIIHAKNRLVEKKPVGILILPALVSAGVCSFFASNINSQLLKTIYGVFIITVGALSLAYKSYTLVMQIVSKKKEK